MYIHTSYTNRYIYDYIIVARNIVMLGRSSFLENLRPIAIMLVAVVIKESIKANKQRQ